MNDSLIKLATQLIAKPSITPNDAGCQELISARLSALDFKIEKLRFGDVDNLWARRGNVAPLFVFAGHTDVVPSGPIELWASNPFRPEIRDGNLYGRGAADMKSSIAVMIIACEQFIAKHPHHRGSIAFLITSDEEGQAVNGTAKVIEYLQQNNTQINWCLVGEASCEKYLGDTIKTGRRGSLNGKLTIQGKQGHVAYPHKADNPIHRALLALHELSQITWDNGNEQFPPTSFQISNIHAGTGANNVIPGNLEVVFNFRYSTAVTAEQLQQKVHEILDQHKLNYQLNWHMTGKPFLTATGELLTATCQAIGEFTQIEPTLSTSGGTSDGRFIATTGAQVIELGPCNHSIHQIDEHVQIADLEKLLKIYERLLELLLL